ncbi:hypothetical protein YC2023_122140 [Brassica napus]
MCDDHAKQSLTDSDRRSPNPPFPAARKPPPHHRRLSTAGIPPPPLQTDAGSAIPGRQEAAAASPSSFYCRDASSAATSDFSCYTLLNVLVPPKLYLRTGSLSSPDKGHELQNPRENPAPDFPALPLTHPAYVGLVRNQEWNSRGKV